MNSCDFHVYGRDGGRNSWAKWWYVAGVLVGEGWLEFLSKQGSTLDCIRNQGRAFSQWWYADRVHTQGLHKSPEWLGVVWCQFPNHFLVDIFGMGPVVELDWFLTKILEKPPVVFWVRYFGLLVETLLLPRSPSYAGTDPLSVFWPRLDGFGWDVPVYGRVEGFFDVILAVVHSFVFSGEGAGEEVDVSFHLLPVGLSPDDYSRWGFRGDDWL